MAILKIGSFNIKNTLNKKDSINNAKVIAQIIKEENIDILGTQELTKYSEIELNKNLEDYKCYGSYRLGKYLFKNSKFNENNIIITNKKVTENKTIWLPWIAKNFSDLKKSIIKKSIMPRIATIITINDQELGKIKMINTHLDHKIINIKEKQLEKIKNLIEKTEKNYQIILTGDFNLQEKDEVFQKFIKDLEQLNMKKVIIEENTWIGKNGKERQIDHIFIPNTWKILEKGILNNKEISDHKPIYVKVEISEKKKKLSFIAKIKKKLFK